MIVGFVLMICSLVCDCWVAVGDVLIGGWSVGWCWWYVRWRVSVGLLVICWLVGDCWVDVGDVLVGGLLLG